MAPDGAGRARGSLVGAAQADELFKLANNQKISCSRGLAPGKLNTATCKSPRARSSQAASARPLTCEGSLEPLTSQMETVSDGWVELEDLNFLVLPVICPVLGSGPPKTPISLKP